MGDFLGDVSFSGDRFEKILICCTFGCNREYNKGGKEGQIAEALSAKGEKYMNEERKKQRQERAAEQFRQLTEENREKVRDYVAHLIKEQCTPAP